MLTTDEKKETLNDFISQIKEKNPSWLPQFVMADNCGAEFGPFLKLFPRDTSEFN